MVATRCYPTSTLQSGSREIDELFSTRYNEAGAFLHPHRPLTARSAELNLDLALIKPDKETVKAELATLRKRLEQRPHSWVRMEGIGRCLRWLWTQKAST